MSRRTPKLLKYIRVNAYHDVYDHIVRVIGVVESNVIAVGKRLKVMYLYKFKQLFDTVFQLAVLCLMMYLKGIGE